MKQNLLKFALCAMALLPMGAWADEISLDLSGWTTSAGTGSSVSTDTGDPKVTTFTLAKSTGTASITSTIPFKTISKIEFDISLSARTVVDVKIEIGTLEGNTFTPVTDGTFESSVVPENTFSLGTWSINKNGTYVNGSVSPANKDGYVRITFSTTSGSSRTGSIRNFKITCATTAVSTSTGRNYATYTTSSDLGFSAVSNSISAYVATGVNNTSNPTNVILENVDQVPSATPLIIKTTEAGATVKVPQVSSTPSAPTTNYMVAATGSAVGAENFVLVYDKSEAKVLFKKAGTATLAEGKAYLSSSVLLSSATSRGIGSIGIDDGTTGIEDIKAATDGEENVYYTLQGVRVERPTKGIYICNGKKVFVK